MISYKRDFFSSARCIEGFSYQCYDKLIAQFMDTITHLYDSTIYTSRIPGWSIFYFFVCTLSHLAKNVSIWDRCTYSSSPFFKTFISWFSRVCHRKHFLGWYIEFHIWFYWFIPVSCIP